MGEAPAPSVGADDFRDVIGRFASGVTVITTLDEHGAPAGTTASAVSSLSLEPPMLLVCMNQTSSTGRAMAAAGRFVVNVLGEDDHDLAMRFAGKGDKFAGVDLADAPPGAPPVLAGALASIGCRVAEEVHAGTHVVFIGAVEDVASREGAPLAYFRGRFGRLDLDADRLVYEALREEVVAPDADGALDAHELAGRLDAPRAAVQVALARLASEALLERRPDGRYAPREVSEPAVEDAYAARRAIELGVVELTVGRVDAAAVDGLRERAERAATLVRDGAITDPDGWARSNADFHEHHVGMAGSASLASAYRHLGLAGLDARAMRRALAAGHVDADALVADHAALVAAYQAADADAARAVVSRHAARRRPADEDAQG